jgi:MYXO-CTERM domain-containing protein
MKIWERKILTGIFLVGMMIGFAATANSTQAEGNLQTVPTRGPSPTAEIPTTDGATSAPSGPTDTAVQPAASATPLPSSTASPTEAANPGSTELATGSPTLAPDGSPTAGAILTSPSDTPPPSSSISGNTPSSQRTETAASGGGSSWAILVAGPLGLIILVGLFFSLRRRRTNRK